MDFVRKWNDLGAQGWELTAVVSQSGAWATKEYDSSYGASMNGVTTSKIYYFKRPKM